MPKLTRPQKITLYFRADGEGEMTSLPPLIPARAAFAASQLLSDCAGAAGAAGSGRASRANFRARRMFGSSELLSKVRSLKQFGHCI
jgi:hypothetical protein